MDGFGQDETEGQRAEGTVIARSLLATKRNALEALEFADGLLDARPRLVWAVKQRTAQRRPQCLVEAQ